MKTSILLIDDDPSISGLVKKALDPEWMLESAFTLAEAKDLCKLGNFDIILLDVNLPDGDGLQFCQELLQTSQNRKPIIFFLTSRRSESDVVTGFLQGADDYITKPFKMVELKARIGARVAKIKNNHGGYTILKKGNLVLNTESQKVSYLSKGKYTDIKITRTEFKILICLMKRQDSHVTREQLLDILSTGPEVTDRAIDQHISRLRKKISSSNLKIESRYGEGYVLTTTESPKT